MWIFPLKPRAHTLSPITTTSLPQAHTDTHYNDICKANLNILFDCAATSAENRERGERGYVKESREEITHSQTQDRLFVLDITVQQCYATLAFLTKIQASGSVPPPPAPAEVPEAPSNGQDDVRPFWREVYKIALRKCYGDPQVAKEVVDEITERPQSGVHAWVMGSGVGCGARGDQQMFPLVIICSINKLCVISFWCCLLILSGSLGTRTAASFGTFCVLPLSTFHSNSHQIHL